MNKLAFLTLFLAMGTASAMTIDQDWFPGMNEAQVQNCNPKIDPAC